MVLRTSQLREAGPEAECVASNLGDSMNDHVMNRDWDIWGGHHCLTKLCNGHFGKQELNSNLIQNKSIRQRRRDKQER